MCFALRTPPHRICVSPPQGNYGPPSTLQSARRQGQVLLPSGLSGSLYHHQQCHHSKPRLLHSERKRSLPVSAAASEEHDRLKNLSHAPSLGEHCYTGILDKDQGRSRFLGAWFSRLEVIRGHCEGNLKRKRTASTDDPPGRGPSIAAVALWGSSDGRRMPLLTDEERAQLAVISSVVRFKKGTRIYREGTRAVAVFNIISGVVKSYRTSRDGTQDIAAFLFPDDLIGLAKDGRYVNSAAAVTAVTGYRIPVAALETRIQKIPGLEFHVICKLCHELREAQRHAFLLSKHHALAKVALFLQMLENYETARGGGAAELYLPMSRSDIGDYVGMSLETVSRSFRTLASQKVITLRDRRHVKINSRSQLEDIASRSDKRELPRRRPRRN